jgi:hypothetical protein
MFVDWSGNTTEDAGDNSIDETRNPDFPRNIAPCEQAGEYLHRHDGYESTGEYFLLIYAIGERAA